MAVAPLARVLLATLLALHAGSVQARESTAGAVAAALEGEEAECRFLLNLCWAANVSREHLETTPRTGGTDTLLFRQLGETALHDDDAVAAARVLLKKHGGKRLWCFDEPECAFLEKLR